MVIAYLEHRRGRVFLSGPGGFDPGRTFSAEDEIFLEDPANVLQIFPRLVWPDDMEEFRNRERSDQFFDDLEDEVEINAIERDHIQPQYAGLAPMPAFAANNTYRTLTWHYHVGKTHDILHQYINRQPHPRSLDDAEIDNMLAIASYGLGRSMAWLPTSFNLLNWGGENPFRDSMAFEFGLNMKEGLFGNEGLQDIVKMHMGGKRFLVVPVKEQRLDMAHHCAHYSMTIFDRFTRQLFIFDSKEEHRDQRIIAVVHQWARFWNSLGFALHFEYFAPRVVRQERSEYSAYFGIAWVMRVLRDRAGERMLREDETISVHDVVISAPEVQFRMGNSALRLGPWPPLEYETVDEVWLDVKNLFNYMARNELGLGIVGFEYNFEAFMNANNPDAPIVEDDVPNPNIPVVEPGGPDGLNEAQRPMADRGETPMVRAAIWRTCVIAIRMNPVQYPNGGQLWHGFFWRGLGGHHSLLSRRFAGLLAQMEEDGQAPVFDDEIVPFHVESHPRHHNPPPVEEIVWPDGPEYTAVAPMDPAHRGLRVSVEILTEVLEDGEAREGEIDDRATKTMDMALEVDLPGHRTAHITLRMPHNLEAVWSQEGWLFGRFSFRPYHHGYQDELQGPVCLMTYPLVKINRLPGIAHGLAALYNPPQPVHPASPVAQRGRGQAGQRGGRAVRRGRGGASAAPPPQAQDQDRPVADGPAPRRSRRLRRPVERLGFDERDETPPPAARRARGQTRAAGAASSRANARRRGGPGTSPRNGSRRGARGGIVPLP